MSRICEHILDEKEINCEICGTSLVQMKNGYGCIWRDIPDKRLAQVRPEPKEREYGVYDSKMISSRLEELYKEKTELINYVNSDESGTDWDGLLA